MNTNELARSIADRITWVASQRGLSINKMLTLAGVSKSVVDRMKLGNMPSADKISAISAVLNVPTDFILGSGVFEKWDMLLSHKTSVLSIISGMMKQIAVDLAFGVDDLTYAKIVSIFSVDVDEGNSPAGTELLVISPIATSSMGEIHESEETEKAPAPGISENGREMLALYEKLPEREQVLLLGRLQEMTAPLLGEAKKGGTTGAASSAGKVG
ncbi:helix-turn-helix domain-containing protein [Anaerotruncus colihominis]|uniref:helix-turn-helix domain-containing protein n=1 Tax=Anaerotruncus colihominis TaxID=169435 RepID=UPI00174EC560|nr:helix-turn-helix transcriptional regulator [Anaerotruncus colihominis]